MVISEKSKTFWFLILYSGLYFVLLSGSLWDLFKRVGYFHPLYDLLVGFQVKEVVLMLSLVISSPFLPLFLELLLLSAWNNVQLDNYLLNMMLDLLD